MLHSWLQPGFPIGAFSYSHGLEAAAEAGLVTGVDELAGWLAGDLAHGSGRQDALFLAAAWHRADAPDRLADLARLAAAWRGTAELALETGQQGRAFLMTVRRAWPHPGLERAAQAMTAVAAEPPLPVATGLAAGAHRLPLGPTLLLALNGTIASLVSAALRLLPLGQTDGQRVTAQLAPTVAATAAAVAALPATDAFDDARLIEYLGTAAVRVDVCSARHETQYSRLFRS